MGIPRLNYGPGGNTQEDDVDNWIRKPLFFIGLFTVTGCCSNGYIAIGIIIGIITLVLQRIPYKIAKWLGIVMYICYLAAFGYWLYISRH
jgi:hypothetical protein